MNNPRTLITKEGIHVLKEDTHISRWVEEHKSLTCDPYLFKWLLPKLADVEVVWDIGAFIGDHTLSYLSLPNVKRVYAFEPNPDAFYCLERNVGELSDLKVSARCWCVAVSDHNDKLTLNKSANAGASRLSEEGKGGTRTVVLDKFMQGTRKPDFVKIDVEGWEVRALQGMSETLRKSRPTVFIEINKGALAANNNTLDDIMHIFDVLEYRGSVIYPSEASLEDEQYDLLFTP